MSEQKKIEALFSHTVALYGAMVARICGSYSTPRVPAEDMYQEVMASLWLGLKSFRGQASLSTWVYRVTINACISFLRRYDNRTLFPQTDEMDRIADEETAYGKDEYDCLRYLIGRLGAIDKALILLWLEERSYEEIAEITGLSANVVGTRLSRIRSRLQKLWKKENNHSFSK